MMGRLEAPGQLFYDFSLERHVPADHLLRRIDAVLDLSIVRMTLAEHYSHTGRPSVDPELMIRMLLVGYLLRHPLRDPAVRRGPSQPGLPLVLPPGPGRPMCRTARPSPRTATAASATATCSARCSKQVVRSCMAAGLVCRPRRRGGRQRDRRRRQPRASGSG